MTSRKMMLLKSTMLLIGLGTIAGLVACSSSSKAPQPVTVTLSTVPTSLVVNGTFAITATTDDTAGVAWTATCGSTVAGACGTFSSLTSLTGVAVTYTAPAVVPPKTIVITATSASDDPVSASTPAITITASSIRVSLSTAPTSVVVNGTFAITATTDDTAGVTWKATCSSGSACGRFSSPGSLTGVAVTYTAPAAIPTGDTVTITASSVTDKTVSASTPSITITSGSPSITVSLSSAPTSLYVSDFFSIIATTNDTAGVSWSCTPGNSAATCGSFSSHGSLSGVAVTYTAPPTVPASTVVITATSVTNNTASASTPPITVNASSGITVTLGTLPASLPTSGTASIKATTNDSAGVNWSCAPAGSCGTFSPARSLTGVAVTYTAPAAVPAGNTVTMTATSVTDDAKKASGRITITSVVATGLTAGQNYVFSLFGADANGAYSVAGVFTVGNNGTISAGEQDFVDYYTFAHDHIASGTVVASEDGNLIITLTTCNGTNCSTPDTVIGVNGVETLDASLVSTSKALLIEYDSSATSSGELDLQTSPAALCPTAPTTPCGYAFYTTGFDPNGALMAIGGVITIDGANGRISGNGSVFDANDSGSGNLYPDESFTTSSVSPPDSLGYVTFTLNSSLLGTPGIILDGYIVDANHIRLIENSYSDNAEAATGGTALGQGADTGLFSNSSISGSSLVFGTTGADSITGGAYQVAGVLTANSGGTMSGNLSYNDTAVMSPQGGDTITGGTYAVDSTGRVTITGLTDTAADFTYNLRLYLAEGGHALVISMDTGDVLAGFAFQQASSTFTADSFSGSYAFNVTQATTELRHGTLSEMDDVGTVAADGASALVGFLDVNESGTPTADLGLSGNFAVTSTNGAFTGTTTDPVFGNTDHFTYYVIGTAAGTANVVAIENDADQLTLGYFDLQQ